MTSWQRARKLLALVLVAVAAVFVIGAVLKTNTSNPGGKSSSTVSNSILQKACKDAPNDYPAWAKTSSDIIMWENPDKTFDYRTSPEDHTTRISSPVNSSETLVDMDFVGENEITYVAKQSNGWKIGLFKLNGLKPPDNAIVYEETKPVSYINISPITKNEFIVFYTDGSKALLEYLDTASLEKRPLLGTAAQSTDNLKVAVSPKGTHAYLLYNNTLDIFEIASKKQIDSIALVKSVVWLGNANLLYADAKETFIYSVKTKEKSKVPSLDLASDLSFSPNSDGVLAYTYKQAAKAVNCKTWQSLGAKSNAEIKTLTSERTAIMEMKDFFGYWRFENTDWDVRLFEGKIPTFTTVWKGY